jgi:hypothetical protein
MAPDFFAMIFRPGGFCNRHSALRFGAARWLVTDKCRVLTALPPDPRIFAFIGDKALLFDNHLHSQNGNAAKSTENLCFHQIFVCAHVLRRRYFSSL